MTIIYMLEKSFVLLLSHKIKPLLLWVDYA
jgi:hypothetical protein